MRILKNLKLIIYVFAIISLLTSNSKSTEECFEGASRAIFKFNLAIDNIILEPIAKGYSKLPDSIKTGTGNFTSNISVLLSIPNNLLQGDFKNLGHSIGSFAINSTVGILGFLNPAEKIGLSPSKEDVGQTLGTYGFGPGCYLVLPILGPSTARDALGILADTYIDPFAHVTLREKEIFSISGNELDYYSIKATGVVDFRADNIKSFESLEKNSIDLYSSYKSIYLQDRENKISNSVDEQDEWGSLDN